MDLETCVHAVFNVHIDTAQAGDHRDRSWGMKEYFEAKLNSVEALAQVSSTN